MNTSESRNTASSEFTTLKIQSALIGADPWQIQGAGGNTSIKQGDVLWIKASGKWLMHANDEDIFVPVRRSALLEAFRKQDPRVEKSLDFIIPELNPKGLRPSIETTLHAVLEQRVVIHVHCIDTIAIAIRQDAQQHIDDRLAGFNWVYVPYTRPGLPLSRSIAARIQSNTDVLVLGNHGLVVAADSIEACLELLHSVRYALRCKQRMVSIPQHLHTSGGRASVTNNELASRISHAGSYQPAQITEAHAIAFDDTGLNIAAGGSLYPDHVIFLGDGSAIARLGEDSDAVVSRYLCNGMTEPVSIVFPGAGVAMHKSATAGQQAMARCLSDVCVRTSSTALINYLSSEHTYDLLNWEAEKYRQALGQETSD